MLKTKLKGAAVKVKDEVVTHRAKITFLVCAAAHIMIVSKLTKNLDEFLTDHDIDPMTFWIEDYDKAEGEPY